MKYIGKYPYKRFIRLDCFIINTWHAIESEFNQNPIFMINVLKLSSINVKSDKKIEIGIISKLHFVSLNFSDLSGYLNLIEKYKRSVRKNFKKELIHPLIFFEVIRKIAADIHESPTKFREIPALE